MILRTFLEAGDIDEAAELLKKQRKLETKLDKMKQNKNAKSVVVDAEDIADVVSVWTKIPVNKLTEQESNVWNVWKRSCIRELSVRMKQLMR